jgi:hypothetical protein
LNHSIFKQNVTPGEALVFLALHGPGCLANVKHVKWDEKRSDSDEYQRLRNLYGHSPNAFDENAEKQDPILRVFGPVMNPKMPNAFADIGIDSQPEPLKKSKKEESILA